MENKTVLNRTAGEVVDELSRRFSGYGVVFNSDSVPLEIWDPERGPVLVYERITREAVEAADTTDVIAAINHDFSKILGRTTAGTLSLDLDNKGVRYSLELPNTSYANDLLESAQRGDFEGSSFTFAIDPEAGYDIEERADGSLQATIKRIIKIYEMGPVTNPAYPTTTAENRSAGITKAVSAYLKREAPKEENKNAAATRAAALKLKQKQAK